MSETRRGYGSAHRKRFKPLLHFCTQRVTLLIYQLGEFAVHLYQSLYDRRASIQGVS